MNAVMTYASLPPQTRPANHPSVRPTGVGRLFVTTGELLISLGERTARRPQLDTELLAAHTEDRRDLESRAHSGLWP